LVPMRQGLALISFLILCSGIWAQTPINALIITGGHDFDRVRFFEMFESFEGLDYTESVQPLANVLIEGGGAGGYDVLIFYDQHDSITESQKQAYFNLGKAGKPMVFLHHSFSSYQYWPEYDQIIGGGFNMVDSARGLSHYKHDVMIGVKIADPDHPITAGLTDFTAFDEAYGNCKVDPGVHPLLSTDHPLNMPHLAWTHSFKNSEIVFIQLGHGPHIFGNGSYRKLVYQSILWSMANNPRTKD